MNELVSQIAQRTGTQRTRPARLLRLRSTSLNQSCPASAASSMACCRAESQAVVEFAKKYKKAWAEPSGKSRRNVHG